MKTTLRTLLAGILALACVTSYAQNRTAFAGLINAYDFAYGINPNVGPLTIDNNSTATGTVTYTVRLGYVITPDGRQFVPFNTNAPITVGTGGTRETVTPTAVSCTTPLIQDSCQVTASFTYAHGIGEPISSGSYGVEEAAIYAIAQGGGVVMLSPAWFTAAGGHSAGLTALVTYKSLATSTYVVADYSGITGALSYAAASGSVYASTTHVLY